MRLALALLLLTACPSDEPEESCFVGTPGGTPSIRIVTLTDDGFAAVEDGDTIPIVTPPQGSKVILPGVIAENLGCQLQLTASLTDECSDKLLSVESRPVRVGKDGTPAEPMSLSSYANLQTCPRSIAERDIEGEVYLLKLEVRDAEGRTASRSIRVTPTCGEPWALEECKCECDHEYELGQECTEEPDGGVVGCAE